MAESERERERKGEEEGKEGAKEIDRGGSEGKDE